VQTLSTKRGPKLTSVTLGASSDELLPQQTMAYTPLRSLLTPTVFVPIMNYAMVAFLDVSFRALLRLFLSSPTSLGGLGFTPSSIGSWLAFSGIADGVFQRLFFAKIVDRLGPKRLFCISVSYFCILAMDLLVR
jgi:MFS family permease